MTSKSLQERPEKTAEVRAATAHRIRPPHTQGQVTPQSRWHSGHSRIALDSTTAELTPCTSKTPAIRRRTTNERIARTRLTEDS